MSWKTAGVPSKFNESNHILATISFVFGYGIIMVPVQFMVGDSPMAVATLRSIGILFGVWVILGTMFLPKFMFIFLKKEEREPDSYDTSMKAAQCHNCGVMVELRGSSAQVEIDPTLLSNI